MSCEDAVKVGDIVEALEGVFQPVWAEEWDRVGLIVGERDARTTRVVVTLDATREAVERAAQAGARLLLTHHPPFLSMPERLERVPGPQGTLAAALERGVAVASFHTNLDRSPEGAEALPRALGLDVMAPLESAAEHVSLIVTYVPPAHADDVRHAMAAAGAGRIGLYEGCAFECAGTGRFKPLEAARPAVPDEGEGVDEVRVEMIAPRALAESVLAAAREAHPYEEPVVVAFDAQRARGAARLGRLCAWDGGDLRSLARHVSQRLGGAVRVWGDPDRTARRVAVANGSASGLIGDAMRVADVLVAGEVRYHDALDACAKGLAIIEAGHDASEWPLVEVLAEQARRSVASRVPVDCETPRLAWQTVGGAYDRR